MTNSHMTKRLIRWNVYEETSYDSKHLRAKQRVSLLNIYPRILNHQNLTIHFLLTSHCSQCKPSKRLIEPSMDMMLEPLLLFIFTYRQKIFDLCGYFDLHLCFNLIIFWQLYNCTLSDNLDQNSFQAQI